MTYCDYFSNTYLGTDIEKNFNNEINRNRNCNRDDDYNMKAVGYCRVSTEEQAREGVSLENQREKIKAYALVKDLELTEIVVDAGLSAKNLKREGMQKVLKMLEDGEAQAIIIYKLDRLTRSTKDLLSLVYDVFLPQEIALHSINETLDTSSANGRFFLTMLGGIATWERETIGERTRDALCQKKKNGEWCGRIPTGFKVKGKKLEADPAQVKQIQKAKRMKRSGMSLRKIAQALNLSKSTVHVLVNDNLKSRKSRYVNTKAVQVVQ